MIGSALWGFKPNLMRHIVEQHGALRSLGWFVRNMPSYERTLQQWGPIRTHLLAVEISLHNGCPYCTYGHVYALQLHYFKTHGRLLFVTEDEIVAWHSGNDDDITANLQHLLSTAGLASERPLLDRVLILRQGAAPPTSVDDHKVAHLLSMFSFLNRSGVNGHAVPDQAHDPINKELGLRTEYSRLRRESGSPPS